MTSVIFLAGFYLKSDNFKNWFWNKCVNYDEWNLNGEKWEFSNIFLAMIFKISLGSNL